MRPITLEVKARVAELVGLGLTYAESAGACGISEKSVERIMSDPQYRRIADDERRKRSSMQAQAADRDRNIAHGISPDGNPVPQARPAGEPKKRLIPWFVTGALQGNAQVTITGGGESGGYEGFLDRKDAERALPPDLPVRVEYEGRNRARHALPRRT